MNIKELRETTGMTQKEFAEYFNIPVRTIQDWEGERRTPPQYVVELIEYKLEKENNKMKRENNFKILKVEEQNPYTDIEKSLNGGGYSQPCITFTFNGVKGKINDTSCGEFGIRFLVEFGEKSYSVDTIGNGNEEYSSFSKNCLEDRLLSKQLKKAGYSINFLEDLSN